MPFLNLTPHTINIAGAGGAVFPPSGVVARVACTMTIVDCHDGIDMFKSVMGEVTGLPAAVPGTFLIVSGMVRSALPDRGDLVSPGDLVRDDKGHPSGCKGFIMN